MPKRRCYIAMLEAEKRFPIDMMLEKIASALQQYNYGDSPVFPHNPRLAFWADCSRASNSALN